MDKDSKKVLPKDIESDYSLPGRLEESTEEYFGPESSKPKSQNRTILVVVLAFVIVSFGFFSFYLLNQDDIDSRIIQNASFVDPEKNLESRYSIGEYGSDHAHAAFVVVVDGEQINFSLPHFQLSSRYIHFENGNPHLIHKHATDVPLEMLFESIGMEITPDCILLKFEEHNTQARKVCAEQGQSLMFYVNGEKYSLDISQYVIKDRDRILVSSGDENAISKHLAHLESLRFFDVPKKSPQHSGSDITV